MQKHFLIFIPFLFYFNIIFAQFAVVNDVDGYVNIRLTPKVSKNIIDVLHNDEIIWFYE